MASDAAIHLQHVTKTFGHVRAVDDLSLDVQHGEIFGVIGPNGAGKTTAVNMITGMMAADQGSIRTLGLDPIRQEKQLREVLGVQFQETELPALITVREALELYASFYDNPRSWRELVSEWDLEDKLGSRFGKLSGGQKQRLFICLALLNNPKLVVLDELTSGLDPAARRQSWDLVNQVRDRGTTVLLVTHFMDEAEHLCDRIALIFRGHVRKIGTPAQLTRDNDGSRTVMFTAPDGIDLAPLGQFGDMSPNGARVRVTGDAFLLAQVAAWLQARQIDPPDLGYEHESLEDMFLKFTDNTSEPTA